MDAIGKRYQLQNELDRGGMGVVYRAQDRLTGQTVALKKVLVGGEPGSSGDSTDFRLALAEEFKTLATLRHPNIISVLDYGFDAERQPYFTMELLERAQNILEAGRGRPVDAQFELLIQVLQALAYLHRRGVIHHDLKPANILSVNDQVKVLDFGLAVARERRNADEDSFTGTLAYTAPEVVRGEPVSEQSDLYAVGVIAYEVIAGRYPFNQSNLIVEILNAEPDLLPLELEPPLSAIIARLLTKNPEDRYQNAQEVISAYAEASQKPLELESSTVRESFLQAARFVGRATELSRLSSALMDALQGKGSAWLVGGESGVGKSRLLDELRTLALVKGARALRGQAVSEGGLAYQVWRDVLRELCLQTELTALETSVLKTLVPDIGALLNRPVDDPPPLEPDATQMRLFQVMAAVLKRQKEPLLIILEDMHWATGESALALKRLSLEVSKTPALLVASYRDDERPNLPKELPAMRTIKLERLSRQTIGELSASMLGEEAGRQAEVIELLERESEGNIFFIVEVVRALAEGAGQLAQVGQAALPEKIFSGGMQMVIERRLSHVPENARPLLRAAAISGRQLDLEVLKVIYRDNLVGMQRSARGTSPLQNGLDLWLSACTEAAILEAQGDRWRFAHDKLREGLLANLPDEECRTLHRRVAQAMEKLYSDAPEHAAALAYHWQVVGDGAKEAHYSGIAGEQASRIGAHRKAIGFLERALAAGAEVEPYRRAMWERAIGEAHYAQAQMTESLEHLKRAAALLGYPAPASPARLGVSILGNLVRQVAHRAAPGRFLGRTSADATKRLQAALVSERIAQVAVQFNDLGLNVAMALQMLNLAESAPPSPERARAYAVLCTTCAIAGMYPAANAYLRYATETARQVNDPSATAWVEEVIAYYLNMLGRWDEAQAGYQRGMDIAQELGDGRRWIECVTLLSQMLIDQGKFDDARERVLVSLERAVATDDRQVQIFASTRLIDLALMADDLDEGLRRAEQTQAVPHELSAGESVGRYSLPALVYARRGEPGKAWENAEKAKTLALSVSSTLVYALKWYTSLAEVYLTLWESGAVIPSVTTSELRTAARQASGALSKWGRTFPIGRPAAQCWQGVFDWLDGKPDKARAAWQKSLVLAQNLRMSYDEGLAHYQIGRHLAADDPQRADHLKKAVEIFKRIGETHYQRRARAAEQPEA